MRWRGGVFKPPDQERKKLLQRPASSEIPRLPGLTRYTDNLVCTIELSLA
jgi:hypothetical protein